MPLLAMDYWRRVDELLDIQNKTLKELAFDIDVSYDVVRAYRYKNRYPKSDVQFKIANALHTSIDYLMTGKKAEAEPADPEIGKIVSKLSGNPKLTELVSKYIESVKGLV